MDLTAFADVADRKVIITHDVPDGDTMTSVETEGTLMAVAPEIGIMVRPKGRQQGELITADRVTNIEYAETAIRDLKQKTLKVEGLETVRQHLADRHGYKLSDINPMSPADALAFHGGIDHSELGHGHNEKKAAKDSETAVADSAQVPSEPSGEAGTPSEY